MKQFKVVERIEADPRLAVIAPPNEAAIVSSFELSGAITGRMQLTIPFAAVEPAKKLLSDPPRVHSGGDARFTRSLCDHLDQVKVELCARPFVDQTHFLKDGQGGSNRPFRIVLMGLRVAEINDNAVTQILGHISAKSRAGCSRRAMVVRRQGLIVLGVQAV